MKKIIFLLSVLGVAIGAATYLLIKSSDKGNRKEEHAKDFNNKDFSVQEKYENKNDASENIVDIKVKSASLINNRHKEASELMLNSIEGIYNTTDVAPENTKEYIDVESLVITNELDSIADDLDKLLM